MKRATEGLSEGTFRRITEPRVLTCEQIGKGVAGSKRATKNFVLDRGTAIGKAIDDLTLDGIFQNNPTHADGGCNDEIDPAGVVGGRFEVLAGIFVARIEAAAGNIGVAAFVANGGFAEHGTDFEIGFEDGGPSHGFETAVPVRGGFAEPGRATLGIVV